MGSGKMGNDKDKIGGAQKPRLWRHRSGGFTRNANFFGSLDGCWMVVGSGQHRHRRGR